MNIAKLNSLLTREINTGAIVTDDSWCGFSWKERTVPVDDYRAIRDTLMDSTNLVQMDRAKGIYLKRCQR